MKPEIDTVSSMGQVADNLQLFPVVLCGGTGTRLWPLSRRHFPKQFVPMLAGGSASGNLFRATVQRASRFNPQRAVIVCNEAHRFFVSDSLRGFDAMDFSILAEPVPRNTAPAIAIAALEIADCHGDGLMLVLPSDHTICDVDAFDRAVHSARGVAEGGKLVTFGVVPDHPETGYGYIRKGEALAADGAGVFHAAEFREKPDADTARRWLSTGDYYWNSGMFLFKASAYLMQLEAHAPEVQAACRQAYAKRTSNFDFICPDGTAFESCPDISVDYAVMEKAADVALVPASIGWNDVGSWDALAPLLEHDSDGNAVAGDVVFAGASDNVVYAGSRLVSVLGLRGCIVVETPDAVLVADRNKSQQVKSLVEKLREQGRTEANEHRKVYRPWGSYESVDAADGFQVKRIVVNPGQGLSLQMHHKRSEHWVIVRGEVRVTRGEEQFTLGINQSTYIPIGIKHRLENPGDEPAHLIEVQCGDYLGEDDIVRFEDNYGRTDGA